MFQSFGCKLFLCIAALSARASHGTTVVDIAVGSPDHTTLVEVVTQAGLVEALMGEGPLTVFAPTNEAFEAIPDQYTEPEWAAHLQDVLLYHVAAGNVTSGDLALGATVTMLNGETTNITSLDPPMINQATIAPFDLFADNGVVHVVDSVLLPPSATNDIVDIAASLDDFSTLASLLGAAGLIETLQGPGPFTVFAPTNDAFAMLDNETVSFLTSPEGSETLIDILLYHVADGILLSSDASSGMVEMINNDMINVTVPMANVTVLVDQPDITVSISRASTEEQYIMINDAKLIQADVLVNNGVIHVIDKVLIPPPEEAGEEESSDDEEEEEMEAVMEEEAPNDD